MWASTDSTIDDGLANAPDLADGESALEHAIGSSPEAPRLLVFSAAGRTCVCELSSVREIIPYRRATRLPGSPPFVNGLINLRGSIITVLDLGLLLGGAAVDADRGSIVLVASGNKVVGLGVDELRDVQRVSRTAIEPAGEAGDGGGLVSGVMRTGDDVAVLLDVGRILGQALL